jgi:hypothetical protein
MSMSNQREKPTDETPKCFLCSKTDQQVALFRVLFKGEKGWACAQCVPVLIHGKG